MLTITSARVKRILSDVYNVNTAARILSNHGVKCKRDGGKLLIKTKTGTISVVQVSARNRPVWVRSVSVPGLVPFPATETAEYKLARVNDYPVIMRRRGAYIDYFTGYDFMGTALFSAVPARCACYDADSVCDVLQDLRNAE